MFKHSLGLQRTFMIQRTNGVIHNIQKFFFVLPGKKTFSIHFLHGFHVCMYCYKMTTISDNIINYAMQGARVTSAYPWGGKGWLYVGKAILHKLPINIITNACACVESSRYLTCFFVCFPIVIKKIYDTNFMRLGPTRTRVHKNCKESLHRLNNCFGYKFSTYM